ncbi:type II toxin-antitoxin system VapB family antitoxin [Candidatus Halobeggiatoa sp. HSG11]|nr:type II toxin-antitoxin system VapB family antitoxin [Candidatus Halobeggiatoa sp. HSG11]
MKLNSSSIDNTTQVIRLPISTNFPEQVKKVIVRVVGNERILSPIDNTWDNFFHSTEQVSDDFMEQRASQQQSKREDF